MESTKDTETPEILKVIGFQLPTWLKTDGAVQLVLPKNKKIFELEELQFYVGGHIELVALPYFIG